MAEGSKTEKATPKKRRDERKKGNVFLSKDAVAMATLLGIYAVLRLLSGLCVDTLGQFMSRCFAVSGTPGLQLEDTLAELAGQMVMAFLKTVGILAAVVGVCAIAATFFQTKLLVSGEALKPKLNRISPLQGLKRLFSLRSIIESIKGILKITVLLVIIYTDLSAMFRESSKYFYVDIPAAAAHLFDSLSNLIFHIALAFGAIAALDFLYQWWDYERQLKMTKQEVKEEYKQMEGDPQIKSKIRELQRRRAQARMMQQVPGADVVIRNPTHYAVALRYKPDQDNAPIVLALGQDSLALRIVKTAEEHHVAVIENPPLARALFAQTELGQEIPPELYGMVAEVLVYIFHLNKNKQIVK
ncbi:MAG: flagellar biosynthesis protein FlhB [Dorea sp.]|nr:flagellar biosynthesis protein FlhB [Dorea sp.]